MGGVAKRLSSHLDTEEDEMERNELMEQYERATGNQAMMFSPRGMSPSREFVQWLENEIERLNILVMMQNSTIEKLREQLKGVSTSSSLLELE